MDIISMEEIYKTLGDILFKADVMVEVITSNLFVMTISLIINILIFRLFKNRRNIEKEYSKSLEKSLQLVVTNFGNSLKSLQEESNKIQQQQQKISMQYSDFLSKQYSDYKKIQDDTKIMSGLISQNENMQKELGRLRAILKRKDRA